jgi:hypothetical protein
MRKVVVLAEAASDIEEARDFYDTSLGQRTRSKRTNKLPY